MLQSYDCRHLYIDAVFTKLHANCDHYLTVWMCSSYKNPACQHYRQMESLSIQLQTLATSPLESFIQPCSSLHDYANFHQLLLVIFWLVHLLGRGDYDFKMFLDCLHLLYFTAGLATVWFSWTHSKLLFTLAACQNLD